MSMTVFELMATLGLNTVAFEQGLNAAEKSAEGMRGVVGGAFSKAAETAKVAMAASTAAVGAFGASAVNTGMNFDASMSQVVATMGYGVDELHTAGSAASETYKQLSEFAQQMGATTKFSASESADALNFMALAGYDAKTSMEMLPNVLNLAAAGGMELADASDMVTDAQSALGLTIEETTAMVDQMARASSKSNTSVSQLGSAILTVGGTAKDLAGGTVELSAALGVLANNGVKGAEGGTALRNILLSLTPKSDDAADAFERLGFNAYDADGNLRPLNETFRDLAVSLEGMSTKDRQNLLANMFNKVDLKSVNAMLSAASDGVDKLSYALEASGVEWENYADTAWSAMDGGMTKLADEIRYNLQDIGSTAEETAQYIADEYDLSMEDARLAVESVSNAVDDSTSSWQDLETAIADSTGAAEDMAKVQLDNLKGDLTILQSSWEGLQIAVRDAVDEQSGGLRKIVQFASGSLSDITAAIKEGGLIGGLKEVGEIGKTEFGKLAESAKGFYESFKTNIPDMKEFASNFFQKVGSALSDFRENVGNYTEIGVGILSQIADGIKNYLPVFMENWAKNWQSIIGAFSDNISGFVDIGGKIIGGLIEGVETALPIIGATVANLFSSLGGFLEENLPMLIEQGLQMIVSFTGTIRENIGPIVDAGLDMILSLAKGIADGLPALIENIPTIVSNIAGIINDNLPKILETGLQIIVTLGVGLIQAIPTLIANIPQIIKAMIDVFMAYNWLSFGAKIIGTIGSGIKSVASHIPGLMKEIGGTAKKKMASIDWIGLGKTVISTIVNGIRALISEIPNLLRSIGENGLNVFRNIDWAGLGRSVISFIASGVKALFYDIPNALINIGREGFNAFLNIDWFSIGTNIIQGIVNGLAYSAQAVYNTILNIASNALSAIMNFFGISSPSKVMRDKVGKMLAEGIGVGFGLGMPIDEMKGTLQDAVYAISDVDMSALDELGEDFIGISDFSSGNDFGDSIAIEKIDIEDDGKGRRYPADNVTINVYAREGQDEKAIAEEVMRLFTLWDNQKKRVYA